MNTFNLRSFLTENRLTSNSKKLQEIEYVGPNNPRYSRSEAKMREDTIKNLRNRMKDIMEKDSTISTKSAYFIAKEEAYKLVPVDVHINDYLYGGNMDDVLDSINFSDVYEEEGVEMAKHIKWVGDDSALVSYNGRQYTITYLDEGLWPGDRGDDRLYFVFTTDELPDLAFTTLVNWVPDEDRNTILDDDDIIWKVEPLDEAMKKVGT